MQRLAQVAAVVAAVAAASIRYCNINGVSGENGLGGGGGGGSSVGVGGTGGSGVVIVRYSLPVTPSNTVAPVISGTAATGSTLTTSNGTWRGPPTSYVYQWQRATATGGYQNIATATSSSYVVSEFDVGYFIKVSVTGTNGLGSASATSAATTAVVDIAPTNTALPVISGIARNGATLTTSNGSWTSSPTSFAYQWQRASDVGGTYNNITSATSSSYVVDESDVGYFIKVSVIATNGIGPSSAALSAATTAVVDIAPTNTALPVISGIARTGATLTTTNGSWTSSPTSYTYQWQRASTVGGSYSDIASETGATYVVDESDVGDFIKVSVIATNGVGSSAAVLSAATTAVVDIAPTNTALPVISGTARTGATLTTTNGSWTSSPTSYTYQWKRANTVGGTYSNITSATDKTYELTDADIDKFIKVSVIARNGVGSSSAVLSAATSIVVDLADSVVPTVTSPDATATGFTFTISNYLASYTYVLTTSKGTVSRSNDDVTVTGLAAGESATVTIAVTRTNYKPASKTVTGSATPAATTTTTTTVKPAVVIEIQAPATTVAPSQTPVTTVAQGQASVATIAPSVSRDVTSATTYNYYHHYYNSSQQQQSCR
jgi:large repetitive protein